MTAVSARTLKEARAILFPWVGVFLLCAFPLLSRIYGLRTVYIVAGSDRLTTILLELGIFMGIPLLACLSYGNEFRYKTLDLLVSQPVNRSRIWREKGIVTAFAILSTALIAALSSGSQFPLTRLIDPDILLFLIVVTCSATFWTLVGRSTLGGFALNIAVFVVLLSMKAGLDVWHTDSGYMGNPVSIAAMWAAALAYSAFMLWLGRWMLVHRQSNGSIVGADLMDCIPRVLPAPIASLFRCRPDQVILNLIRKELRLLRPLWLFMALYVVSWSAMAISSTSVPADQGRQRALFLSFIGLQATYTIMALLLAASLALGEERTYGVQLWHLVLPLSIRTQWLIRLFSAMVAAVVCTIAVPVMLMVLARDLLPPAIREELNVSQFFEFIPALVVYFLVAFWCASVARDLIRTAGLMAAAAVIFIVTVESTSWITEQLMPLSSQLRMWVISRFQLDLSAYIYVPDWFPGPTRNFVWLVVAFIAVMTVHTYPLFRRLPQERAAKLLRPLVPYLVVVAVLAAFTTARSWQNSWGTIEELFREVESAIVQLPPGLPYNAEDLAKVTSLHDRTRRWLRTSSMTLAVSERPPAGSQGKDLGDWSNQGILTIQFPGGLTCNSTFQFSGGKAPSVMGSRRICK